jgi:hypothetical protein
MVGYLLLASLWRPSAQALTPRLQKTSTYEEWQGKARRNFRASRF